MTVPRMLTAEMQELLIPFMPTLSSELAEKLAVYLDLLLKWNARTNLTAIREPRQIVQRHFGESLFAAGYIPAGARTLLDVGSGAGFPGLPIALARPELQVTLAESQGKKASFLLEAARQLGTPLEVWGKRVEEMPASRMFDVVTLRAVDDSPRARRLALERTHAGGSVLHLTSADAAKPVPTEQMVPIPGSLRTVLRITST